MKLVPLGLAACLVLAAVGRFNVEADVREREARLAQLAASEAELRADIEDVRLEKEVLESASRLRALNQAHLSLDTVRADQLLGDREAAKVLGLDARLVQPANMQDADIIGNAIGMTTPDLAGGAE